LKAFEESVRSASSEAFKGSKSALQDLSYPNGPLAEYSRLLSTLTQKYASKKSVFYRIVWANAKKDVQLLLMRLSHLLSTIGVLLHVDQGELVRQFQLQYDHDSENARLQDALRWISTNQFRSQHVFNKSLLQAHTADWFFATPEYVQWMEQSSCTLYCPGMPGAGKSVLAAAVIDHLENRIGYPARETNLAYILCDYEIEQEQTETGLLGAIIQQLVQNDPGMAQPLLILYGRHIERGTFPDAEEIFESLRSMVTKQKAIYIVVDALDELSNTRDKRWKFIKMLNRLVAHEAVVRLFCTSRHLPDVDKMFLNVPSCLCVEVSARPSDIKRVVEGRLERFRFTDEVGFQDAIVEAITVASGGL
jgi:hypothetical protein